MITSLAFAIAIKPCGKYIILDFRLVWNPGFQVWNSKLFVRSAWIPSSPAKYVTIIFSQGFIAWRQDNTRKAELEGRTDLGATTIRHDRTNMKFALFFLISKRQRFQKNKRHIIIIKPKTSSGSLASRLERKCACVFASLVEWSISTKFNFQEKYSCS